MIAKSLEQHPLFQLAAISTRIIDDELARSSSPKIYTNSRQMLDSERLDGLIVANSPQDHFGVALTAIEMGLATWIEKPLTLNANESKILLETGRRLHARVLVDHIFVHSLAWKLFKQASSNLGKILRVETWGGGPTPIRASVSPLWDWGPHDISLVLDLLQSAPEKVEATVAKRINDTHRFNVRLDLQFNHGVTTTSHFGTAFAKNTRKISILQEHGSIHLDDFDLGTIQIYFNHPDKEQSRQEIPIPRVPRPLDAMLSEFHLIITSQRESLSDLVLGDQVVQVLALAELSIRKDKNDF